MDVQRKSWLVIWPCHHKNNSFNKDHQSLVEKKEQQEAHHVGAQQKKLASARTYLCCLLRTPRSDILWSKYLFLLHFLHSLKRPEFKEHDISDMVANGHYRFQAISFNTSYPKNLVTCLQYLRDLRNYHTSKDML